MLFLCDRNYLSHKNGKQVEGDYLIDPAGADLKTEQKRKEKL